MANDGGITSVSDFSALHCQTPAKAHIDAQRVFPALSNLIVQRDDGRCQIGERRDAQATDESLADFHERLKAERLKAENVDDITFQTVELMVLMRLQGASIRSMAE